MARSIYRDSRHIRWGWEPSPENFLMGDSLIRYHFVIVDDSEFDRKKVLKDIFEQLSEVDSRVIKVRELEGKMEDSKFDCLFATYDSKVAPTVLNLKKLGRPVKEDDKLAERKVLNLEDYLTPIYNITKFRQVS